jgi:hypothetical protein
MVIMFIEVRGFSALSRNIGAIGTLKLINSLSKRILPIVRENDGYVDVRWYYYETLISSLEPLWRGYYGVIYNSNISF